MKTHDYIHRFRGYWSNGGKCRIRIYQEDGSDPLVVCSSLLGGSVSQRCVHVRSAKSRSVRMQLSLASSSRSICLAYNKCLL